LFWVHGEIDPWRYVPWFYSFYPVSASIPPEVTCFGTCVPIHSRTWMNPNFFGPGRVPSDVSLWYPYCFIIASWSSVPKYILGQSHERERLSQCQEQPGCKTILVWHIPIPLEIWGDWNGENVGNLRGGLEWVCFSVCIKALDFTTVPRSYCYGRTGSPTIVYRRM